MSEELKLKDFIERIKVRLLVTDVTRFCMGVPEGYAVKEKGLVVDGEATYCCSLTPSAFVAVLRYDLERIDGAWPDDEVEREKLYEYEDLLNEEIECYYLDYRQAMEAPLEEFEYESLDEAEEYHRCNHNF